MKKKLTLYIDKNKHSRLDKAIFEALPSDLKLSRSRLQAIIEEGKVLNSIDMFPVTLKTRVGEIEKVIIFLDSVVENELIPQDLKLDIVYEDEFLAVINKPANMSVHPVNFRQRDTLVNGLVYLYGTKLAKTYDKLRPGIVHRLDKDTSGLIVVAKTDQVAFDLIDQFKAREVNKIYLAFCHGHPFDSLGKLVAKKGVNVSREGQINIETNIGRDDKNRELMAVKAEHGKKAISQFNVLDVFDLENKNKVSLIQCKIKTGRTHQIRVHLSYAGHPILGDKLYDNSNFLKTKNMNYSNNSAVEFVSNFSRQALHAKELTFVHPVTSDKKTFYLPLPEDLRNLQEVLS